MGALFRRGSVARPTPKVFDVASELVHSQSSKAMPHLSRFQEITKQIETFRAEAEPLRTREVAEVVARIRGAVTVYGLSRSDLGLRTQAAWPKVEEDEGRD